MLLWAPWAVLAAIALAGTIVAGVSVLGGVCLVVLALAATVLGWRFGESRRTALEEEISGRSHELKRALSELEIAQTETVRRLSMAVEFRDEDTGAHIERIGRLSTLLAEQIGMEPDFCERLSHAAPLHDVGKVAIPDAILLKPGPLTPEERAIVETHAEEGHRLLRGSSSSILELATTIALSTRRSGTAPAIRAVWPERRSRSRAGSWRSPTCSTRSPATACIARPSRWRRRCR